MKEAMELVVPRLDSMFLHDSSVVNWKSSADVVVNWNSSADVNQFDYICSINNYLVVLK
jgi:hypothetical protein